MRRFLLSLVLILIPQSLYAQDPATGLRKQSIQLLESTSLSDKAWGVHLIASLHLTDLQDRLITELRACHTYRDVPMDGPEYAYVQKLFDALIQLDTTVPPDVILPFRRGHRAEVLILLLRNVGIETLLLDVLDQAPNDTEWLAIANSLADRRSARLFERLFVDFPVTHRFEVTDNVLPIGRPGGFVNGEPTILHLRRLPSGFPPTGMHSLTRFPLPRRTLLVRGPTSVFFERTVVLTNTSVGWRSGGESVEKTQRVEFSLQLLAALAGQPLDSVRELFQPTTEIRWRTAAQLSKAVSRKLDEQAADIRSFIAGAKLRRETDMTSVRLEIRPELFDYREQQPDRLVAPPPRIIEMDLQ